MPGVELLFPSLLNGDAWHHSVIPVMRKAFPVAVGNNIMSTCFVFPIELCQQARICRKVLKCADSEMLYEHSNDIGSRAEQWREIVAIYRPRGQP